MALRQRLLPCFFLTDTGLYNQGMYQARKATPPFLGNIQSLVFQMGEEINIPILSKQPEMHLKNISKNQPSFADIKVSTSSSPTPMGI